MRIDAIETFVVPPRWMFVRIATDDGLVGWGEPIVEGRAEVVRADVEIMAEYLVGTDPRRIADHWNVLTKGGFYRGGPDHSSAVAGIDQALWDILGRSTGLPVHALLGGHVRDRVRMYTWIAGDEPAAVFDAAQAAAANGFTAVKMNATGRLSPMGPRADIRAAVDRLAAVREALGDDRDVAIDCHGRFTAADARRFLPLVADLHPLFVEEPVLPENRAALASVTSGPVPIALGERLFHRSDFLPALQAGVAVVQPDLSHAGGISEGQRIATLAETFDARLAPHCPLGPIALAASLQLDFASPNFLIQEQSLGIHYTGAGTDPSNELLDYLVDRGVFGFVDGYVERPTGPGLGIEVDEAAVRRAAAVGHRWRTPVWRHPDGGLAEW